MKMPVKNPATQLRADNADNADKAAAGTELLSDAELAVVVGGVYCSVVAKGAGDCLISADGHLDDL